MLKFNLRSLSFRNRIVIICAGVAIGAMSLLYTNNMARRLKDKEQHDVELWAHAMERANRDALNDFMADPLLADIISSHQNIPFIITDENLKALQWHMVPDEVIDHPDRLRRRIERFTAENMPIRVGYMWTNDHYHIIFYGRSALLNSLYYFPYVQLLVITIFVMLGFIAFRSSKLDEQNRVWIGLAKETAHQL
nr:sensor histidine kinase [Alistipes sp.]